MCVRECSENLQQNQVRFVTHVTKKQMLEPENKTAVGAVGATKYEKRGRREYEEARMFGEQLFTITNTTVVHSVSQRRRTCSTKNKTLKIENL